MEYSNNTTTPLNDTWLTKFHPHWWKYRHVIEDAPKEFFYFLGSFFFVVGLVGIIGNLTVVWVFSSTPSLRTPSNVLLINLAICDLVFSALIGFPMSAFSCFKGFWFWGHAGCQFYSFVAGITGLASINCLTVISVDRYLVVGRPLTMLNKSNFKRSFYNVIIIWSWAGLWASFPLFGWGEYILEGFGVSCTFDYLTRSPVNISFNVALFSCCFGLPVFVMCCCYVGIVKVVIKHRKEFSTLSTDIANRGKQEFKVAKVFAVCIVAFIACWLPYAAVAQMGILGFDDFVTPFSAEIPVMFAKTSALWNPIIYAFSHPKYRQVIMKSSLFRKCCPYYTRRKLGSSQGASVVTQNLRTTTF